MIEKNIRDLLFIDEGRLILFLKVMVTQNLILEIHILLTNNDNGSFYNNHKLLLNLFSYFIGTSAELYYVRDGVVNTYAMNFEVPVPAHINELEFCWQSLTRHSVSKIILKIVFTYGKTL